MEQRPKSGVARASRGNHSPARAAGSTARLVMALIAGGGMLLRAASGSPIGEEEEYRVKLGFLYNFAQYIQWPPEAFSSETAPLTMCVAGPNPFEHGAEQSLQKRTVGTHPIVLKKLKADEDPRGCHVVFVRAGEKRTALSVLKALNGAETLTVGESPGFADLGGIINLTIEENKLRFEINLDVAVRNRLKVSSKLLSVAKIIKVVNR